MEIYILRKEDLSAIGMMGTSAPVSTVGIFKTKELAANAARIDYSYSAEVSDVSPEFEFKQCCESRWTSKGLGCCLYIIDKDYVIESEEELPAP